MKRTIEPDQPIGSVGELIAVLLDFVDEHPNPAEAPRDLRVHVTVGGKIKRIIVTEGELS